MLAMGGNAIIARLLGEGKLELARQRFTQLVTAAAIAGIVLGFVFSTFIRQISVLLGSGDGQMLDYCVEYGRIMSGFAPFSMLQQLFMPFWTTNDKPKYGLILSLSCGCCNICLDYIFVKCNGLGLTGAALATVISYMLGACVPLTVYSLKKTKLYFVRFKWNTRFLLQAMENGVSEMVTNIASAVTTFLFNIILMRFAGANGVAAITVLLYAQFLFSSAYMGFTNGVAPIFSYNYGAGNKDELKKMFHMCIRILLTAGVIIFAVSELTADITMGIFVGNEKELFDMALYGFRIFAVCFLMNHINIFASGYLTALGNGRDSAIISTLRTLVVEVFAILILAWLFGITGVWLAIPSAEFICMFVSVYLLRKMNKRVF
jgi:putative MATE family efflux protein